MPAKPIPRFQRHKELGRCRLYRCRRLGRDTIRRTIAPTGRHMEGRLWLRTTRALWAVRGSYRSQGRYRNQLSQPERQQRKG